MTSIPIHSCSVRDELSLKFFKVGRFTFQNVTHHVYPECHQYLSKSNKGYLSPGSCLRLKLDVILCCSVSLYFEHLLSLRCERNEYKMY